MQNIISSHNKFVLNKEIQNNPARSFRFCRQKNTCPLSRKCQTEGIVYQATVTREDNMEQETYVVLTASTFKTRYSNHTSSFRNSKHKLATELGKHIWTLKIINCPILNQMENNQTM